MNSLRICWITICFIGFSSQIVVGQFEENSTEIWHSVLLDYELSNRWDANMRIDGRYNATRNEFQNYLIEGQVGYEWFKNLSSEVYYRFRNNISSENKAHRLAFQISPSIKVSSITLGLRFRQEWNDIGEDVSHRLRFKLRPKIKLNKKNEVSPYVEWFLSRGVADRVRYGFGWTIRLNKDHRLKIRWMYDDEEFADRLILRLAYQYDLN